VLTALSFLLARQYTVKYMLIAIIFFISGLSLPLAHCAFGLVRRLRLLQPLTS
jgi:hypothetical protein